MSSIKPKPHEPIDVMLRRFKRAHEKSGILGDVRKHECFEKPSERKKRLTAAARKRHLKRKARENPFRNAREKDRSRGGRGNS